jgi:hypothetical protein
LKPTWKLYTASDIHYRLSKVLLSEEYKTSDWIQEQALFCPYYSALEGTLGSDWGVIVNPESKRFGMLTFEHDWCGCPPHDQGNQSVDLWEATKCQDNKETREGYWRFCVRPAGHKGLHEDSHWDGPPKRWR